LLALMAMPVPEPHTSRPCSTDPVRLLRRPCALNLGSPRILRRPCPDLQTRRRALPRRISDVPSQRIRVITCRAIFICANLREVMLRVWRWYIAQHTRKLGMLILGLWSLSFAELVRKWSGSQLDSLSCLPAFNACCPPNRSPLRPGENSTSHSPLPLGWGFARYRKWKEPF
jgi:hypothetical protein